MMFQDEYAFQFESTLLAKPVFLKCLCSCDVGSVSTDQDVLETFTRCSVAAASHLKPV